MNAVGAGYSAFRESFFNADAQQGAAVADFGAWGRWQARRARYDLYWGMYQNNAYQDLLHPGLTTRYKASFGLYKHIRHVYNPAFRIVDFFARHTYGGGLDLLAGDGQSEQSALPILTDHEPLRPAIGKLWKDSRWQARKGVYTKFGAALGDSVLTLDDDPDAQTIALKVVHPGALQWIDRDARGDTRSYILRESRWDPRQTDIANASPNVDPQASQRVVTYTEKAYLDGGLVVYETYLNGEPYAWNGVTARWDRPYGFIPLWVCQHEESGLDWGFNAFHCGLSRFREVDDQASGLSDQVRKAIRAPKLITGVKSLKDLVPQASNTPTQNNPEPDRSAMPYLVGPADAKAIDLTFPLDILGVIAHIADINKDIEQNFPELMADVGGRGGKVTAEEIKLARGVASSKVQAARANYDDVLVKAQAAAVAIAGEMGYPGYEGFGLADLGGPKLDHRIGHRPVFDADPMDAIEEDQAFWTAAGAAVTAGVPIALYLERNGWSEEDIAALTAAKAVADKAAIDLAAKTAPPKQGFPDKGAE